MRRQESVLASFQIRGRDIKEGKDLCLYRYLYAYYDGKPVGFSGHFCGVNHVSFLDNEEGICAFEACPGKWMEANLERERRYAAEVSRLQPIKKDQALLDTRPTSRIPLEKKKLN